MSDERPDTAILLKAIAFAARKHSTQRRKGADASPYINHPIAVAHLLADSGGVTDVRTLMAAVLHDTIEDTETSTAELESHFGPTVRKIVEEMTDDKSLEKAVRKQRQIEHAPHLSQRAKPVKIAVDSPAGRVPGLDGEGRRGLPGCEHPAREALRRGAREGTRGAGVFAAGLTAGTPQDSGRER